LDTAKRFRIAEETFPAHERKDSETADRELTVWLDDDQQIDNAIPLVNDRIEYAVDVRVRSSSSA